jgi:hypothetical protein
MTVLQSALVVNLFAMLRVLGPLSALAACATSHPADVDAGPVSIDAQPCAVRPVYADRGCVGSSPPCDFCPAAEAAFLRRSAELGCCLPFRCAWRPFTSIDSAVEQLDEVRTCDELARRGAEILPGPGEAWPAGSAEWTPDP